MSIGQYPGHQPGMDTESGVVELVRRLADDSKRLARDEVRLAKLEVAERVHTGGRGAMLMAIAFGAGVVAVSALTICLVAALALLIGRMWIAAIVIGLVETVAGWFLVTRGVQTVEHAPRRLPEVLPSSHPGRSRSMMTERAD